MSEKNITELKTVKKRYALLDEVRGFMIFCMIFYHGFYTVNMLLEINFSGFLFDFFSPIEPVFAGGFIFLSGIMCGFSRSNLRRGLLLGLVSAAMTFITIVLSPYFGDIQIYFGILHLLAFSMIFCGIFNFILKKINPYVGIIFCLILFFITYGIPDNQTDLIGIRELLPYSLYQNFYLFPLGFTCPEFFSADYFPILPWSFLFVAGYYFYKFDIIQKNEKIFLPKRLGFFAFLGRHSLLIYLFHQPVIYLICFPFMR